MSVYRDTERPGWYRNSGFIHEATVLPDEAGRKMQRLQEVPDIFFAPFSLVFPRWHVMLVAFPGLLKIQRGSCCLAPELRASLTHVQAQFSRTSRLHPRPSCRLVCTSLLLAHAPNSIYIYFPTGMPGLTIFAIPLLIVSADSRQGGKERSGIEDGRGAAQEQGLRSMAPPRRPSQLHASKTAHELHRVDCLAFYFRGTTGATKHEGFKGFPAIWISLEPFEGLVQAAAGDNFIVGWSSYDTAPPHWHSKLKPLTGAVLSSILMLTSSVGFRRRDLSELQRKLYNSVYRYANAINRFNIDS